MSLSLPNPVKIYFDISNGSNRSELERCFAPDAVVVDEGQTYQVMTRYVTGNMRRNRSSITRWSR